MNQNGVGRLGREYARLRWTLPLWWTATVLVVLACGLLQPRIWVVEFVLRFDGVDTAAIADAEQRLRQLNAASSGTALQLERQGVDLRVALSASDRVQVLGSALPALLDAFVSDRRQAVLQAQSDEQQRLQSALGRADAGRSAAQDRLDEALAALPAGGDTTVAARLGQIQAEAERLRLEVRDGKTRIAMLQARVAELDTAIDSVQPLVSSEIDAPGQQDGTESTEEQRVGYAVLIARREGTREELVHLGNSNAVTVRRAAEVGRLLEATRTELVRLQGENVQVQHLNEALETATRAAQSAQRQLDAHTAGVAARPMPLAFAVESVQPEPRLERGLTVAQVIGLAVVAGCAAVLLRLLVASTIRHETRNLALLADRLHVRALAELPTWRDSARDPAAALRRTASVLVALIGAAACVVYAVVA